MTYYLNKSFDITEQLIKDNPANENEIINNYINYIISADNNNSYRNNPMVRSATYNDNELPFDINIHNNFQRYYDTNNDDDDGYYISNKMDYNTRRRQNQPPTTTPPPTAAPIPPPTAAPVVLTAATSADSTTPTKTEGFNDYFNDLRYGFKDYFSFN
jgi:hypothetical protein